MISRGYSREQRRALNVIWNAAADYQLDPPFMAFCRDGSGDFYLNTIIGLTYKWMDTEALDAFFEEIGRDRNRDEYDDLLWLGIEACIYRKEIGQRPILERMRHEHAEHFFREKQTMSKQQMMLQSMLTFNQQEVRWADVTGRHRPLLSAREQRLCEALDFPGELDTPALIGRMRGVLTEFFRYRAGREDGREAVDARPLMPAASFLKHLMHREKFKADHLVVRRGAESLDSRFARRQKHNLMERHQSEDTAADLKYVEAMTGTCILPEQELHRLEAKLCTGGDSSCRLWITKGHRPDLQEAGGLLKAADREAIRDAQRQEEKNRAYYHEHGGEIAHNIRLLAANFETLFTSFARPEPEAARRGVLRSEAAYRLAAVHDPKVFWRAGEAMDPQISIELLLDASASRMHTQEIIAAQSRILAEALHICRIPVQVISFRSLRGCTVLQILKGYDEKKTDRIMQYYTGGWNRDSLALRTAAELMRRQEIQSSGMEERRKILIVLTDAGPNDTLQIASEKEGFFKEEYEGEAAVRETRDAVRELKEEGICTAAIFYGSTTNMENLHTIYGKEYVRIHQLSQIATGMTELLQMTLREMLHSAS